MTEKVVALPTVLGADIMVWDSGRATVCPWDDSTSSQSPAARDLAKAVEGGR
ncbi:hypothetical protein [Halomarina litorea]|uniref:hypothetical protein n=1 Tax=Halomarina litorea TaxID=2961595 RepID=UPI0020C4EA2A|nr:hypothetical protein [Halomarina sp. BCD28]